MKLEDIKKSACAALNPHLFAGNLNGKKTKYNNKKVVVDGLKFDSKKEAKRYMELKILQAAGEISELKMQVPFQLSVCKYIADFSYMRNGKLVVEDVKSKATKRLSTYRLKKKMMLTELNLDVKEV